MEKNQRNPQFPEDSRGSSANRDSKSGPGQNQNNENVDLESLPVGKIVKLHKKGLSRKEIMEELAGLSEREVKMAVSHYYCNRRSVENKLKREG